MFDCRWCEATNFIDELERNDHESTCWVRRMDEADQRYDRKKQTQMLFEKAFDELERELCGDPYDQYGDRRVND